MHHSTHYVVMHLSFVTIDERLAVAGLAIDKLKMLMQSVHLQPHEVTVVRRRLVKVPLYSLAVAFHPIHFASCGSLYQPLHVLHKRHIAKVRLGPQNKRKQ